MFVRCQNLLTNTQYYLALLKAAEVILFVAAVILGFCFMTALVLDLSRAELTVEELQDTADAIALASTSRLNGTQTGWLSSKRAAFAVLARSDIYGDDGEVQLGGFGIITEAGADNLDPAEDPDSNYRFIQYEYNNLVVRIERGNYSNPGSGYEFTPYETLDGDEIVLNDPDRNKFEAAIATRVTVRLKELNTTFARLLPGNDYLFGGRRVFNDLEATSISALEVFRE